MKFMLTRSFLSRCRRLAAGALAVPLLLGAAGAAAQVVLDTSVHKVETVLGADGAASRRLQPADQVLPGEELRYTIRFRNESETEIGPGRIVITNAVPDGTVYVPGSAGGADAQVEYSRDGESFEATEPSGAAAPAGPVGAAAGAAADGEPAEGAPAAAGAAADAPPGPAAPAAGVHSLRWTYEGTLPPEEDGEVFFHVRMR